MCMLQSFTWYLGLAYSGFGVGQASTGSAQFLFFNNFLLVLRRFLVWRGDSALGYHSMGFRHSGVDLEVAT